MKRILVGLIVLFSAAASLTVAAWAQKEQPPTAKKSGEKMSQKRVVPTSSEAAEAKSKEVRAFMRLKLEHSERVLEGLALGDFGMIKQHAEKLGSLSQDENWQVLQTADYRHHSAAFQRIANRLAKAAQEQNIDSAALEYVQLTLTCVNCHRYVRDEKENAE